MAFLPMGYAGLRKTRRRPGQCDRSKPPFVMRPAAPEIRPKTPVSSIRRMFFGTVRGAAGPGRQTAPGVAGRYSGSLCSKSHIIGGSTFMARK